MNRFLNIKNALAIGLFALFGLGFVSTSSAAPTLDGTFIPSGQPGQMTLGPDGNVWFSLIASSDSKEFGRIAPDGTIAEYDTPNNKAVTSLTTGPATLGGPKDQIWMSQVGSLVRWNPADSTGAAVPLASLDGPRGITADSEGYLWVVDDFGSLIRVSPDGTDTEFPVSGSGGRGITFQDGDLWWADFGQQSVQRSTTTTPGSPLTFDVGGGPQEVAAGLNGQIAYTNQGDFPHTVGLISKQNQVTEIEVPGTDPFGIAFAEDRAYWTANFASDDLTRLTPAGVVTAPIEFPDGSGPRFLARGQNGTLWVGLETTHQIARVTGVTAPDDGNQTKLALSGVRLLKGKKLRIRATLTRAANVRIAVDRRKGKRFVKVRAVTRKGVKGSNVFTLARPAKKGRYRVRVMATSGGQKTAQVVRKFRVKRG